jgi:hypothetical protein
MATLKSGERVTPRKQKINLEKVRASLDTICTKCGEAITPDKLSRIDPYRVECPVCHEPFAPKKQSLI